MFLKTNDSYSSFNKQWEGKLYRNKFWHHCCPDSPGSDKSLDNKWLGRVRVENILGMQSRRMNVLGPISTGASLPSEWDKRCQTHWKKKKKNFDKVTADTEGSRNHWSYHRWAATIRLSVWASQGSLYILENQVSLTFTLYRYSKGLNRSKYLVLMVDWLCMK